MTEKRRYYGIEWLRVIACFGIVMMHMLSKTNNNYPITGFIAETIIPSFTNFVFLFMVISAFGMCVGYYEKVQLGKIDWVVFYKRRYLKVLPFFSVIVFADIIVNHDFTALIEAVPNLTLTRGFFPNNISQIGVAWFLGVIFVFYAIFPLFCSLISTKKSAWISFAIVLLLSQVVNKYYGIERANIIFCLPFLFAGGLIYLYREVLQSIKWWITLPIAIMALFLYYSIGYNTYTCLLVSCISTIQAITINGGYNKTIHFLSEISLEIYLSHMFVFRGIEIVRLNYVFGNGWLQYCFTVVMVLISAICFSLIINKVIDFVTKKWVVNHESVNHQ